ncbi:MAG: sugar-binding protein, partial [Capnocytophaga sp.]|nr:sugar-binding protein [Capnocytophaga sp.]
RYGYVLNNPLLYTDPSGEFIWTVVAAVWETVANIFDKGINFHNYTYRKTELAWQIDKGLTTGSVFQVLSKWTWQSTQTFLGNTINQIINLAGNVSEVTHLEGAVVVATRDGDMGAFTMGNYITGPRNFRADWRDHLFVHEYGHYIQSQYMGPLYLSAVAIPSVMDFWIEPDKHDTRWYEAMASSLGGKHFDKHYGSGASGYTSGNANFFDINSYRNENVLSPYRNPRTGLNNSGAHSSSFLLRLSDISYFSFGRIF